MEHRLSCCMMPGSWQGPCSDRRHHPQETGSSPSTPAGTSQGLTVLEARTMVPCGPLGFVPWRGDQAVPQLNPSFFLPPALHASFTPLSPRICSQQVTDITLPTKVHLVKAMVFPVVNAQMQELDHKEV